jgi:hypothetical protein
MAAKGIRLNTSVAPTVMYMGFNMLDPVVGGNSERARKLRLAISIAIDQEEFILFSRMVGAFPRCIRFRRASGYRADKAGINPHVYDWVDGGRSASPWRRPGACWPRRAIPGRDARTVSRWWSIWTPRAVAWATNPP